MDSTVHIIQGGLQLSETGLTYLLATLPTKEDLRIIIQDIMTEIKEALQMEVEDLKQRSSHMETKLQMEQYYQAEVHTREDV